MVAFWLCPASGAREFFAGLVKELAERYEAPRFEPHVTLSGDEMDESHAAEILHNLSIREAIELQIEGIEVSDKYTKTLFVQFRSTPEVAALSAEIQKARAARYELNPHLSLLYKEMPGSAKDEAARAISLPFARVRFETVSAIVTPSPIRRREDVEAWRMLGSRRLDTAPE